MEIDKKTSVYIQYWKECNIRCGFCSQMQNNQPTLFEKYIIPSKEALLTHNKILLDMYRDDKYKFLLLSFVGGELFHRSDIKELYKGFDYLVEQLHNIRKLPNIQIKIYSDLLFEDTALLEYFIKKVGVDKVIGIKTSFDLYGRFKNKAQVDLYIKNLNLLCSICDNVQIKTLITLDAINKFNPDDYTFQKLKEIRNLPHTWVLDKYKSGDADESSFDTKFNIPNDWKRSTFFAYINGELSISNARMKGSYRFSKESTNNIHFIMNNKIEKKFNANTK